MSREHPAGFFLSAIPGEKAYEKAVQVVNSVQKDLAKLEKHREIWQFQEKRYEEYLADQELDDFKVKKSQDF